MIAASDLSIQNPCQYCGASYQRKSAHLKSCVGIFNGVYLYHRIARGKVLKDLATLGPGMGKMEVDHLVEATQELDLIRALVPQAATPTSTTPSVTQSGDLSSGSNAQGGGMTGNQSKNKYHKGANKGEKGKGKGKGKDGGQTKPKGPLFGSSWPKQERGTKRQRQPSPFSQVAQMAHYQEETQTYHEEIQAVLKMLTTMTLRHEAQLTINRQDTAFVIFLKTDVPDSLATTTYVLGQKWHEMKSATPEKLEAPMRAILFQHLVKTVMDRFEKMVGCPSARSKAVGLGWLSEDEAQILGVRWDAENHQHVKDPEVTPLSIAVVREALQELVAMSIKL
eukprot:s2790_g10.t1